MLETEEVDVDYFTPSTSTSLSKIFGSTTKEDNNSEKGSLKYNAPLGSQVLTKPEEAKQIQFLFAGAVFAYEWVNDSYEFRGRLGFAILKMPGYDIHKMVIYDSNKTTLSSLTIAHNVEIKVNENVSLCYYDNVRKFWSVNPSTPNLKEILEILKNLKVNLEFPPIVNTENRTPTTEYLDKEKSPISTLNEDDKESDTDGAFNRKTKDSILKRMATMGQSVLPPPHTVITQTSDSSDTNEFQNQQKPRHKPKVITKKGLFEKKTLDIDAISESTRNNSLKSEASQEIYKHIPEIQDDQQIMSVMDSKIIKTQTDYSGGSSSLGLFITEQKVSNSELRININRMTDKVDLILNKIKDLDIVDRGRPITNCSVSHFQNEIIQKLLKEYERKINKYEEFIKLKGFDCDSVDFISQSGTDSSNEGPKDREIVNKELQQLCNEKDNEIAILKEKLQLLSSKEAQFQTHERNLLKEIDDLRNSVSVTNNPTKNVAKTLNETNSQTDITNKLKQIMNDTFQAISVNFDDEERYTGSKIKSIVGLVVKKTTIDSLKEF